MLFRSVACDGGCGGAGGGGEDGEGGLEAGGGDEGVAPGAAVDEAVVFLERLGEGGGGKEGETYTTQIPSGLLPSWFVPGSQTSIVLNSVASSPSR